METAILKANDIYRSFRGNEVLRGVNLELQAGESVAVTGRSGAGKTTLLSILGGLDRQNAGTLSFRGTVLKRRDLRAYRRDHVGFLFQESGMIEELTALENVKAAVQISRSGADAGACLAAVGLAGCENRYPVQLSGGECRRAALARAIAKEPELLLLDEPNGGLDDGTGQEILSLVKSLCASRGITLVMVTHQTDFAQQMQRCLTLSDGVLR